MPAGNKQKSGSYGDGQVGPTRMSGSGSAGAGNVKGGATTKKQVDVTAGARAQKSGSKGG